MVLYTIEIENGEVLDRTIIIDFEQFPTYEDWKETGEPPLDEIPADYGTAKKYTYANIEKPDPISGLKPLRKDYTLADFEKLRVDLHNKLWAGGEADYNDIFYHLIKIMLVKIYDELFTPEGEIYDFQIFYKNGKPETPRELAKRLEERYSSARRLLADLLKIQQGGKLERPGKQVREASIAILPFADMSAAQDQDCFCDGLTEELITALSRIKNLRVASRTSTFSYKGRNLDVRKIGSDLGVENVLEGSVRKSGKHLRITAQLICCSDGCHLRSAHYDRKLDQVFKIQEELAGSIAAALKISLQEKDKHNLKRSETRDVEAYDLYLRGRQFFYRSKKRSILYAIQMFERAVEKDPRFTRAWSGLADCYSYLYMYFAQGRDNLRKAQEAASKALSIDSESAEAHASRGLAVSQSGDYPEAEREFETAILLNPRLFEAYYFYARTCFAQGKIDRAIELFREASRVNPEDYQSDTLLGFAYRAGGNSDRAREAYRKGLAKIERHLELNPDDSRAYYLGAEALYELDEQEKADRFAEKALSIDPDDPYIGYGLACYYSKTGRSAIALQHFRKAVQGGFTHLDWIENDTDLDPIRATVEFRQILGELRSDKA